MLNPHITEYRIAVIEKRILYDPNNSDLIMQEMTNFDEVEQHFDFDLQYNQISNKSKEFLKKRYFEHPIYFYRKWIIKDAEGCCVGLLFAREIKLCGAKVLRIVDYRGALDHLYGIGHALRELLLMENYEYIDIMVDSLPENKMKESGFVLLDTEGSNIIPHYFEPFVRSNIKNHYQKNTDVVIFKADGDQDRPNRRTR